VGFAAFTSSSVLPAFTSGATASREAASLDLVRERRVLVVHEEHAVRPGRNADVAAGAGQHPEAVGDLLGLDLDLAEVLLGGGGVGRESEQAGGERGENEFLFHGMILSGR